MNKETRQFIVGFGGTLLFSASLGTQIRSYINSNGFSVLEWVFISITCIGLFYCGRMLYKTI